MDSETTSERVARQRAEVAATGGPAYPGSTPVEWYDGGEAKRLAAGLTIRDWFAGQALVGILAFSPPEASAQASPESAAETAYAMADAMLKTRLDT